MSIYSTTHPVATPLNGIGGMNDGSGTINPAALNSSAVLPPSSTAPSPRGIKRSRSPDQQEDSWAGADEDDEQRRRKRGRPPKTPRSSGDFPQGSDSLPTPSSQKSPAQANTPQLKPQALPSQVPTTPTQTSPPPKPTPKSGVKALPTVRDHTSDQLGPEGDEYIPREFDEAGEKKVDALGYPQDGRQYRCRTFTVPGRGEKLFMLATECARVLTYRDSYLLFNKNRSLYKIIATQKEKEDLIEQEILPFSYRSRQIAIVTARSMFRQFGSRVIVGGRRVRDDYWEGKARKQGFTEDDPAGEKRPGASRAREAAVAETQAGTRHTFAQGDVVYSSGPGFEGMPPPDVHLGLAATMAPLPMINIADDHRFRDIARPRQEMTGPPYQDRTQSSTESEIMNQAAHTADFSKVLNQQRNLRSSMIEEYWNRPHEPPASSPQSQPVDASATNLKQSASPRFGSIDISSSQPGLLPQQNHPLHQHMNPPPYPHQQNPMQSPLRQSGMQANALHDPAAYQPQPHLGRSSSSLSMSQSQPQPSPYGAYQQHNPLHPSQQGWGGPPPPQQSPVLNRMQTPHYSPSVGQRQIGQVPSPIPGQHQPSPSPHPPPSMQPPQMLHHQSSTGSLSGPQMYGAPPTMHGQGGFAGMAQRQMYTMAGHNQTAGHFMPQTSQPGMPGWPSAGQQQQQQQQHQQQQGGWSGY